MTSSITSRILNRWAGEGSVDDEIGEDDGVLSHGVLSHARCSRCIPSEISSEATRTGGPASSLTSFTFLRAG